MSLSVSFNETAGFSKSIFFCFSRASDESLPKKNENNVSAADFSVRRNSNYITAQRGLMKKRCFLASTKCKKPPILT